MMTMNMTTTTMMMTILVAQMNRLMNTKNGFRIKDLILDDYRDETIKTYTAWLRDQGFLKEIIAFNDHRHTNLENDGNGPHREEATPTKWPPHARKIKKTKGGKKVGRGTLKGIAAMGKRLKSHTEKLRINFSPNLGDRCGDNRRTFVDEVVMYTKLHTPLIGVRHWKNMHQDVKNSIVESTLNGWLMENSDESKEKIWKIAKERYKGWQSPLSATYRAYSSYEERMTHKPEDLDIVEWHYLITYFGSKKFKKVSSQNSMNRQQMKTLHVMGSKPFSKCSWEKRDPETGAEPGVLELFKTTHTKQGKWSNEMAETIYHTTTRKLSMTESGELGEEESRSITSAAANENQVFQAIYKETTGAKLAKVRGHGYLSNASKNQLLQEKLEEQEREVQRLREQLEKVTAEKEAEKKQLMASLKEEMAQEMKKMMEQNQIQMTTETNKTPQDTVRSTETNNETEHVSMDTQVDETTEHGAMPTEKDIHGTPMNNVETTSQPRSIITIEK